MAPERPQDPPARPIDFEVVEAAITALWGDDGAEALAYVRGRGLTNETIRAAHLGYSPGGRFPAGIVIPWGRPGAWRFVNIRRPEGRRPKYLVRPAGARKG